MDTEGSSTRSAVVRAAAAPSPVWRRLSVEALKHGDLHLARDVAWNETRIRGPVLSFASWLRFASKAIARARFVGKVDDDAYIYAPDLQALLLATVAGVRSRNIYLGVLTWYSWYPAIFEVTRHGWSHSQARDRYLLAISS